MRCSVRPFPDDGYCSMRRFPTLRTVRLFRGLARLGRLSPHGRAFRVCARRSAWERDRQGSHARLDRACARHRQACNGRRHRGRKHRLDPATLPENPPAGRSKFRAHLTRSGNSYPMMIEAALVEPKFAYLSFLTGVHVQRPRLRVLLHRFDLEGILGQLPLPPDGQVESAEVLFLSWIGLSADAQLGSELLSPGVSASLRA